MDSSWQSTSHTQESLLLHHWIRYVYALCMVPDLCPHSHSKILALRIHACQSPHHCKVSHWDTSLGDVMTPSSSIRTEYFRISLLSSWKPKNWLFYFSLIVWVQFTIMLFRTEKVNVWPGQPWVPTFFPLARGLIQPGWFGVRLRVSAPHEALHSLSSTPRILGQRQVSHNSLLSAFAAVCSPVFHRALL